MDRPSSSRDRQSRNTMRPTDSSLSFHTARSVPQESARLQNDQPSHVYRRRVHEEDDRDYDTASDLHSISSHPSRSPSRTGRSPRRPQPHEDEIEDAGSMRGRRTSLSSRSDRSAPGMPHRIVETQPKLSSMLHNGNHTDETDGDDDDDDVDDDDEYDDEIHPFKDQSFSRNIAKQPSALSVAESVPSVASATDERLKQLSMQNQALMEHINQLKDQLWEKSSFHSDINTVNSSHLSPCSGSKSPVPSRHGSPSRRRASSRERFSVSSHASGSPVPSSRLRHIPAPPLLDSASVHTYNGHNSRVSAAHLPLSAPQQRRRVVGSSLHGTRSTSPMIVDEYGMAPLPYEPIPHHALDRAQEPDRVRSFPDAAVLDTPVLAEDDAAMYSPKSPARIALPIQPASPFSPGRAVLHSPVYDKRPLERSYHSVGLPQRSPHSQHTRRSLRSTRCDDLDRRPSTHIPSSIVVAPETHNVVPKTSSNDMLDDRSLLTGEHSHMSSSHSHHDVTMAMVPHGQSGSGASAGPDSTKYSFCHEDEQVVSKKKKKLYNDPIDDYVRIDEPPGSRCWKSAAVAMTCIVPDCVIPKEGAGAKLAWREKAAICIIVFLISLGIVGGIGFMPIFLCRSSDYYTQDEINKQSGEAWVTIFGIIYDVKDYIGRHPGGSKGVRDFLGQDASALFPRLPPSRLPAFCLDTTKPGALIDEPVCPQIYGIDRLRGIHCHTTVVGQEGIDNVLGDYKEGELVIAPWDLGSSDGDMQYIVIDDSMYNVTQYIDGLRDEKTRVIDTDPSNENAYLFEQLHLLIVNKLNEDATALYDDFFFTNDYKNCLDMMFYHAQVDRRHDQICASIGIAMYFLLFVVTFMMLVQVFCSLLYLARRHPHFTDEDKKAAVMIMVPCYNETDKELLKTIDSVLQNDYPEENKILVVVADGVITGAGATASTPAILGKILGFDFDCMDEAYEYKSLGKVTKNYISVYSGVYEKKVGNQTKRLKYMVMVKQGAMNERGKSRAGNRGKRDSQLVITGMLNRLHYNREPTEFDEVVKTQLDMLDIPLKDIEYMMAIDADTRVHHMAMPHMIYSLEHNKNILACCGETQVDNKAQSWVTMIQVFEYFSSHHMKKAFESVFGCVTCLPGCFTMYRLFTEDMNPLISSDIIFQEYSRNDISSLHEKNLYELGEDRMLTTLLLQHFPGMRLNFVPEAICWTIVPHTFSILLSQRRRWINSTLHNMFELLKVETMCGICCVSMKTIVIADLLATLILPASIAYLGYLTYLFITKPETIDTFVLYFYAITVILMMVPFLIRSRWDYMFWFVMYVLLGIPTFYFILPLYSFIHMDDFSWGKTRMVSGGDKKPEEDPAAKEGDGDKEKDGQAEADADKTKTTDKDSSDETERHSSSDADENDKDGKSKTRDSHSVHTSRSTRTNRTAMTAGSHSKHNPVVEAVTVGTDSGEILIYFKSARKERQPYLAPAVTALEMSEDLRQEYSIDAILTRPDPSDPTMPMRADPDDPDEEEVWFVLIRRIRALRENNRAFRRKYTESVCDLFQELSAKTRKKGFNFQFGIDLTPEDGTAVPLGDYVTSVDTIAYIQDVNPSLTLDALALDRDTLGLYFGEDKVNQAKDAVLDEMFMQKQASKSNLGDGYSDDDSGSGSEMASFEGDSGRWNDRNSARYGSSRGGRR